MPIDYREDWLTGREEDPENQSCEFRNKLDLGPAPPSKQNTIVAVAGRKGSGKSTVTREILLHCDRLFLFDTMSEHSWIPDQFTDVAEAHYYIFERGHSKDPFRGSFICEDAGKGALERSFVEICNAVYETGNMTLAVEELPMLSQPNYVPEEFDRIIRTGRHHCINVLYTGQRLSECPRRVTAATDIFVLFHHSEPRDLDAIAERCGPEVAEMVAQLGDFEFLVYSVKLRSTVIVDNEWYNSVLIPDSEWTPAYGGKHGRHTLWSLNDGDTTRNTRRT